MAKIGHAVCDENGLAQGGKPGNQTGRELRIADYYTNTKGWNLIRAKSDAVAVLLANAMKAACGNLNIGYSQSDRGSLQVEAKKVNYDLAAIKTPCNCDCSSLVRCCCFAAGLAPGLFSTANQVKVLLDTGAFDLIAEPWGEKDLRVGDILVTKTKGHTAIVVSGSAPTAPPPPTPVTPPAPGTIVLTRLLKYGVSGADVIAVKRLLMAKGFGLNLATDAYGNPTNPNYAGDTRDAVCQFQARVHLKQDGIVGRDTITALGGDWGGK
ncbi:MAG: peptidoglycan-binding protein [Clostridiales bacterium]|nr:peptidoglycan-binding protein [Clostridiales bacterium]